MASPDTYRAIMIMWPTCMRCKLCVAWECSLGRWHTEEFCWPLSLVYCNTAQYSTVGIVNKLQAAIRVICAPQRCCPVSLASDMPCFAPTFCHHRGERLFDLWPTYALPSKPLEPLPTTRPPRRNASTTPTFSQTPSNASNPSSITIKCLALSSISYFHLRFTASRR